VAAGNIGPPVDRDGIRSALVRRRYGEIDWSQSHDETGGVDMAEVDVLDAEGQVVRLRACRPADLDALRGLLRGLSARSRYLRFFSAGTAVVEPEAARLTRPPDDQHAALLAETADRIVGVASYERIAARRAEFAVLVAESWQGRGVGTALVEELATIARENGIDTLVGDVLADNTSMLAVSRGLDARSRSEPVGVVGVEIATLPGEAALAAMDARDRTAEHRSLAPALAPRSVAVVGAGRRPGGVGHEVLASIVDGGFTGPVFAVNRNASRVCGVRSVPSMADLPEPVDLMVVAVPAAAVPDVLTQAADRDVRAAVVLADEAPGPGWQAEIRRIARAASIRLIGPNCLGVINTDPAVLLSASFAPRRPKAGGLAVASQSGAVGIAILDGASRSSVGVSTFVSLGNKADVSGNDLLAYWYDEPRTRAVALYLESFGNPGRFARLARQLGRRKPVLAVKSGRSASGRRAGAAHSAAAGTPDDLVENLFAQAGVIRTADPDELLDAARMLVDQPLLAGERIGIVGNAGGLNVLAADAAEAAGLTVPELPAPLTHVLGTRQANPVDLGAACTPTDLADAARRLGGSGAVDCLVVTVIALRTLELDELLRRIGAVLDHVPDLPAAVVLVGASDAPPQVGARGVPVYASGERALRAVGHAARYARWRREPVGTPITPPGIDTEAARTRLRGVDAGWLPAADTIGLLADYGIPVTGQVAAPGDAGWTADRSGYPVAGRAATPDTDADDGHRRLRDEAAMRTAAAAIGRPEEPALVEPTAGASVELMAGVRHDRLFGPLVVLAAGGDLGELIDDRVVHLLPLTDRDATAMWRRLRIAPLLTGHQGMPAADTGAVEQLLARLARLAADLPQIAELDLTPVVAGPTGLTVLDARVRVRVPSVEQDPYQHRLRSR